MHLKQINHVFILIVSFLLMTGCGGSSSSDSNTKNDTILENKDVAMLIPLETLEPKSKILKTDKRIPTLSEMVITKSVENGKEWMVYDKNPEGATITIDSYDEEKQGNVISFKGDGVKNGYVLGYWAKPGSWNEKEDKIIRWNMKYSEDYYVYVLVTTPKGYRFLYYTPTNYNYGIVKYNTPHYIHHGLGLDTTDGTWKTFTRDLEQDLKDFEPNNHIITIDGFFIRGSGKVNEINLLSTKPSAIYDAIESWVDKNGNYLARSSFYLSEDKTRAVIHDEIKQGIYNVYVKILDISNLDDIKVLASDYEYRYTYTRNVKMKEGEYIILLRSNDFLIYDYTTGKLLSRYVGTWQGISYITIEDNYIILSGIFGKVVKVDFRDRENLIVTNLYQGNEKSIYTLSDNGSKILVKDKDGNLITEILIP